MAGIYPEVIFSVAALSLLIVFVGPAVANDFDSEFSDFGDLSFYKRADLNDIPLSKLGYHAVPFRCTGATACRNGGVGIRRLKNLCICYCPANYAGPACKNLVADLSEADSKPETEAAAEKKQYPWLIGKVPKSNF